MSRIISGSSYTAPSQNSQLTKKGYNDALAAGAVPAGVIMQFSGNSIPSGWLQCDGSAIDRTTYAALFAVISTLHGAGNGSSTFNIPDLRKRVPVGKGSSDTVGQTDGIAEGSRVYTHTHSVPAHYHALGTGADLAIGSSGSTTTGSSVTSVTLQNTNIDHTHPLAGSGNGANSAGSHTHSINDGTHVHEQYTTANSGGSGVRLTHRFDGSNYTAYPMNAFTSSSVTGLGVNSAGSHSHSLSGNTGTQNSATTHNHGVTDPGHTHSAPNHTHGSGAFAGRVGLVTGGVDGNAAMTSGATAAINYTTVHHIIKT